MTQANSLSLGDTSFDSGAFPTASPRTVSAAIALLVGMVAGACLLDAQSRPTATAVPFAPPAPAGARQDTTAVLAPLVAPAPYDGLIDPAPLGPVPATLASSVPLGATFETIGPVPLAATVDADAALPVPPLPPVRVAVAAPDAAVSPVAAADPVPAPSPVVALSQAAPGVPLPAARPPELDRLPTQPLFRPSVRRLAQAGRPSAAPTTPADGRSFFERIFGAQPQPAGPVMAYASPEDGAFGKARQTTVMPMSTPFAMPSLGPAASYDHTTAIYDIAAHTVYMPNGARLEAHSGLGDKLDDPRHVSERNRGATPPHVYDLEPRAQLFHGVRALRLNPVGSGSVFGRTGLLAHTYMLGPNGDSNGCVSFRDYNAFLQAYARGEVRRLAVVARL